MLEIGSFFFVIHILLSMNKFYGVKAILSKTRGPQALTVTCVSETYTDFLSEGLIFVYQQPHHRINENQLWYRKAAS